MLSDQLECLRTNIWSFGMQIVKFFPVKVMTCPQAYHLSVNPFSANNEISLQDSFLLLILQQVNKSIGLLVPKVELFVDSLLSVQWTERSPLIIEEYLSFVQTLVSAHSCYCKSVVRMLVSKFILEPQVDPAVNYVHEVLQAILGLIPL